MWQHAKVYNAVLTHDLRRLDMRPAEISWHIIWLWHEGMVKFDHYGELVVDRDDRGRRAA